MNPMTTSLPRVVCNAVLQLSILAAVTAQADWSQAAGGLPQRSGTYMVFDTLRERAVLFGGYSGAAYLNDTWEHDGTGWSLRAGGVAPNGRTNGAATFDAIRGRLLLFGGFNGSYFNDTWAWSGTAWTQVAVSGPSARSGAAMAHDRGRDRVVLFGGSPGGTSRFGDTWEFDGASWMMMPATPGGPSARTTELAYDEARGSVVMFGGAPSSGTLSDTWTWNGVAWSQLVTSMSPPARWRHGMDYDRARQRIVVFGGSSGTLNRDDTWELTGNTWTQITTATVPTGRYLPGFACDSSRDTLMVFGGNNGASLGDAWELAMPQRASYRRAGAGCAGSLGVPGVRSAAGLPWLGTTFVPEVTNVPAPGLVWFVFGFDATTWNGLPLPLDLGAFGMPNCLLRTDAFATSVLVTASNTASWSFVIPNAPGLLGVTFYNQALVVDPGVNAAGAVVSDAMRAVFGTF
jgi:hypothetical protein